jgi:hypothetical protein
VNNKMCNNEQTGTYRPETTKDVLFDAAKDLNNARYCTQCGRKVTKSERPQDMGLSWCKYCSMITDGVRK